MRISIICISAILIWTASMGSRLFVAASSQGYRTSTSPVSTYPTTIAAWFRATSQANQAVASICNTSTGHRTVLGLLVGGTTSYQTGAGGTIAPAAQAVTTNVWHHYAGVSTISGSTVTATAWLDGTSTTTTGTDAGAQSWNAIGIAERHNGTAWGIPFNGDVEDVAIWNVGLVDAEVQQLYNGACPVLVRPANLVFWVRAGEVVVDRVGGLALTADGSPTISNTGPRTRGFR